MDDFATGYLAGQDGGNNNGGFFGNEGQKKEKRPHGKIRMSA